MVISGVISEHRLFSFDTSLTNWEKKNPVSSSLPSLAPGPVSDCRQWEGRSAAFHSFHLLCRNIRLYSKVKSHPAVICTFSLFDNIFVSVLGTIKVSIFAQG